jgi:hypothetical protein
MKLVTVPRAYNVDVVLVVGLAEIKTAFADDIDNLRHLDAFAGRAALMRAIILIGVVVAAPMEDTDLHPARLHDPNPALRELTFAANQDLCHACPYVLYYMLHHIVLRGQSEAVSDRFSAASALTGATLPGLLRPIEASVVMDKAAERI